MALRLKDYPLLFFALVLIIAGLVTAFHIDLSGLAAFTRIGAGAVVALLGAVVVAISVEKENFIMFSLGAGLLGAGLVVLGIRLGEYAAFLKTVMPLMLVLLSVFIFISASNTAEQVFAIIIFGAGLVMLGYSFHTGEILGILGGHPWLVIVLTITVLVAIRVYKTGELPELPRLRRRRKRKRRG